MIRLLSVVLCLAAIAAPAAQAGTPTSRDRADARAYLVAYDNATAATQRTVRLLQRALSGHTCGAGLRGGSPVAQQIMWLALMEQIARQSVVFSHELDRIHAHDAVLRAYATAFRTHVLPRLAPYAKARPIDICTMIAVWKRTGYSASFDVASAAGVASQLVAGIQGVISQSSNLIPAQLRRQTAQRLIAFGISLTDAQHFVTS